MAIENLNIIYNKIKFNDDYPKLRLVATQHDTGRVFYFQVLDDTGQPFNATGYSLHMYVSINNNAGYAIATEVDIASGKYKVIVPNELLSINGDALVQLQLRKGTDKIATLLGELKIEKSIESGATVGKDVWIDFLEIEKNIENVKNLDAYKQISQLSALNDIIMKTTAEGNSSIMLLEKHMKEAESLKTGINNELKQLDESKAEVKSVIMNAKKTDEELKTTIQRAETQDTISSEVNQKLDTSISEAKSTNIQLEATDVKGKSTDMLIKGTIEDAENRKNQLSQSADLKISEVDGAINRLDEKIKEADGLFDPVQIIDDLITGGSDKALSAEQGKILFQYANNGKEKIAQALLAKEQEANKDMSFVELSEVINTIKTGYEVGDIVEKDNVVETKGFLDLNIEKELKILAEEEQGSQMYYYNNNIYFLTKDNLYKLNEDEENLEKIVSKPWFAGNNVMFDTILSNKLYLSLTGKILIYDIENGDLIVENTDFLDVIQIQRKGNILQIKFSDGEEIYTNELLEKIDIKLENSVYDILATDENIFTLSQNSISVYSRTGEKIIEKTYDYIVSDFKFIEERSFSDYLYITDKKELYQFNKKTYELNKFEIVDTDSIWTFKSFSFTTGILKVNNTLFIVLSRYGSLLIVSCFEEGNVLKPVSKIPSIKILYSNVYMKDYKIYAYGNGTLGISNDIRYGYKILK